LKYTGADQDGSAGCAGHASVHMRDTRGLQRHLQAGGRHRIVAPNPFFRRLRVRAATALQVPPAYDRRHPRKHVR
jgi:hypothetical protein